jgi:hypothetical protein
MSKRIVVGGSVAQRPGQGGHTWLFVQYALGLKRLGWDVLLLDRLEPDMCRDAGGAPCRFDASWNLAYWTAVLEAFGLGDRASLIYDRGAQVAGVPMREVLEHVRSSACLLNVMGFIDHEPILEEAPLNVFVDIDPGFTQMWQDLGQTDFLDGHDAYVTVGANLGRADCAIPTCGLDWIAWRQPVVLEYWRTPAPAPQARFTSVGAWRGPYAPVEYGGRTYGLRAHEFRQFASLPGMLGRQFEVALDIGDADARDRELLHAHGWTLADPAVVARDPWSYRRYIWGSGAEFMIAKGMYSRTNSGWFSDRSICYLAAGRPVLAQATGIDHLYPTGEGLVTFSTLDDARAGAEAILGDYERHARAARDLAEEYFDSDRVFGDLLARLGAD